MKKIDLKTKDFNEDHLFWYWSVRNLSSSIWDKLRYDSFKDEEFCMVSDVIEDIMENRCLIPK